MQPGDAGLLREALLGGEGAPQGLLTWGLAS